MTILAEGELNLTLSQASLSKIDNTLTAALKQGHRFGVTLDPASTKKVTGDLNQTLQKAAAKSGTDSGNAFGKSFSGALTGVAAFTLIRQGARLVADSVAEFAEARAGIAQTNAVLKSTGQVAGITGKDVDQLATRLSQLAAVDDDVVRGGANVLLTFTKIRNETGKGNDVFNRSTAAALDLSTALGTDLQGSIIQVGKALNDPIKGVTALSRVGVSFTEQQKTQIETLVKSGNVLGAQKIILRELSTEFGGTAKALADADGGIKRAAVSVGELKESIGGALAPALAQTTPLAAGLATTVASLPSSVTGAGLAFLGLTAGVAVVLKLRDAVGSTAENLAGMGRAGKVASTGLATLGRVAGIAAVVSLVEVGIDKLIGTIEEARAGDSISGLAGDLARLADGGIDLDFALEKAGTGASLFDQTLRSTKRILSGDIFGAFDNAFSGADEAADRLDRVDKALAELVNNGAAKAAATDLKLIADRFNIPEGNIAKVFNDYTKALDTNSDKAAVGKAAQKELAGGLDGVGDAAGDAAGEVRTLDQRISDLSDTISQSALGQFVSWEEALVRFRDTQLRLGAALKENGFNFDINTEKGIENRDALLTVIDAAQAYVEGQVRAGKVAEDGAAFQDAFKVALGEVADRFPVLRGEIDKYIGLLPKADHTLKLETAQAQTNTQAVVTKLGELDSKFKTVNPLGALSLSTSKAQYDVQALIDKLGSLDSTFRRLNPLGALSVPLPKLPGREHGGDVIRGRGYIVGERRAELFVPGASGTIYPSVPAAPASAGGMAGNTTTNNITVNEVQSDPNVTAFKVTRAIGRASRR